MAQAWSALLLVPVLRLARAIHMWHACAGVCAPVRACACACLCQHASPEPSTRMMGFLSAVLPLRTRRSISALLVGSGAIWRLTWRHTSSAVSMALSRATAAHGRLSGKHPSGGQEGAGSAGLSCGVTGDSGAERCVVACG